MMQPRRAASRRRLPCGEPPPLWGPAAGCSWRRGWGPSRGPGSVFSDLPRCSGPHAAAGSDSSSKRCPGFLERVARSLRAGVSTVAAMGEAVPSGGPLAADLGGVMADVRVGRSLLAALDRWRGRCPLPEVNLATAALSIGATSGGRRAPAVDGVAATLRENRTAQREVASLAQQGRLSGMLIALLPLCFLALSAMIDGASLGVLYRTPVGLLCLVTGLALNVVAFVWMHRITRLR